LGGSDLDAACARAAGRLDDNIRTKHAGDAERIDCADGVKLAAAEVYAVFCLLPGEWVRIKDDVCRRVAAQEVTRLQLGNEHSKIFYREAGLFANFPEMRGPAEACKKLKNRSPHAVLFWRKGLIPFLGET